MGFFFGGVLSFDATVASKLIFSLSVEFSSKKATSNTLVSDWESLFPNLYVYCSPWSGIFPDQQWVVLGLSKNDKIKV